MNNSKYVTRNNIQTILSGCTKNSCKGKGNYCMNGAGKIPPYSCHISSPSPGPPGPSPGPSGPSTLGKWCEHSNQCAGSESCCPSCHCRHGDTPIRHVSDSICDHSR